MRIIRVHMEVGSDFTVDHNHVDNKIQQQKQQHQQNTNFNTQKQCYKYGNQIRQNNI